MKDKLTYLYLMNRIIRVLKHYFKSGKLEFFNNIDLSKIALLLDLVEKHLLEFILNIYKHVEAYEEQ